MFILYDLVLFFVSLFYLPLYLFRRKLHRGLLLRLGILPKDIALVHPIWIHAVSVGEVMAIKGLLAQLQKELKNQEFVISTVTPTGNKVAQAIACEGDHVTYLPLDFSFIVKRVIDKIKPSLFIIAETEIWPNLIAYLHKRNIPLVVVNGRVSDNSFRGYRMIRLLVKPILQKVRLFLVQTERDAARLMRLGVVQDKIKVTGNMKFDALDYADKKSAGSTERYRSLLQLRPEEKLFVAGSTHPGEEEIIVDVFKSLRRDFPHLRLLIAPRHPERSAQVSTVVERFGFIPTRISLLDQRTREPENQRTVFILDTIGQLTGYYCLADIVFVGGSLIKKGGHNILEPAALGKPVLFGPYMFNFRDIADLFLKNQAAVMVHHGGELKEKIALLLKEPGSVEEMIERAHSVIRENQGATRKNLECISEVVPMPGLNVRTFL